MSHDQETDPAMRALAQAAACGCEESRLLISRRALLGASAGLFSAAFLPRWANAGSVMGTNWDPRLLLVILRGGTDGLNTVVPMLEYNTYQSWRKGLTIPSDTVLALNGTNDFAMHPTMANFTSLYNAGEASIIPSTCVPLRTRSHFDCQDNLENGLPSLGSNPTGWLSRVLSALPSGSPIKLRGGIGIAEAPLVLRGPVPVLGWSLTWLVALDSATRASITSLYKATDKQISNALYLGDKAHAVATQAGNQEDAGDANQAYSRLVKSFRGAARLLSAADGPRIGVISVDDFDTHAQQGVNGEFDFLPGRLRELDAGLGQMKARMTPEAWAQTVVICVSEFGRTVRANGSAGTDHGVGSAALLVGGAVQGGIFGGWPGLAQGYLYEGVDLKPTVDMRSIFKGVLRDHFDMPVNILNNTIFPSSSSAPPMNGLIKTSPGGVMQKAEFMDAPLRMDNGIGAYRAAYSHYA